MAHRYYSEEISGGTATISGADAAHLARVLRAKPGDRLLVCDGCGTDYDGVINTITHNEVTLLLDAGRPTQAEPALWAEVFIGFAKGERMETAIQKSVELGASAIWPFYSEYCVVKPKNDEVKTERFNRIAREAAKQSGRGCLPVVHPPLDFTRMLQQAATLEQSLFFYEAGGLTLAKAFDTKKQKIALITGAEGGFSPAEAEQAAASGCCLVGLGPRILRCETAPVVALAVVMAYSGNLE